MDKEIVFELRKSQGGHIFRENMTRSALRKRSDSHERIYIHRDEDDHEPRNRSHRVEYRTTISHNKSGKRSPHREKRSPHRERSSSRGHSRRESGHSNGRRESSREHRVSRKTRNGHEVVTKHTRVRTEEHH